MAGIFRYFSMNDNGTGPQDLSKDFFGWGINLSTNIKVAQADTIKLQGVFGEGIGNYMNDGTADVGSFFVGDPGLAETLPLYGIVAFYDRTWSKRYTSTFGYSSIEVAFTILDTWQGKGLGTLLLQHLVAIGRSSGIEQFEAIVLPSNKGMAPIFTKAGLKTHRQSEGEDVCFTIEL